LDAGDDLLLALHCELASDPSGELRISHDLEQRLEDTLRFHDDLSAEQILLLAYVASLKSLRGHRRLGELELQEAESLAGDEFSSGFVKLCRSWSFLLNGEPQLAESELFASIELLHQPASYPEGLVQLKREEARSLLCQIQLILGKAPVQFQPVGPLAREMYLLACVDDAIHRGDRDEFLQTCEEACHLWEHLHQARHRYVRMAVLLRLRQVGEGERADRLQKELEQEELLPSEEARLQTLVF
jgi:hypothetical protein